MSDYDIVGDPANGILDIVLRGFWSLETMAAFQRDSDATGAALPCAPGQLRVIVDVTDWPVQSQVVFGALQAYLHAFDPPLARMALVCGPGLARLQFRRVADPARTAIFDTAGPARAWLDG